MKLGMGIVVLRFKVRSISDLANVILGFTVGGRGSIGYINGKLFIVGPLGGGNIVVYYTESEKRGRYIKYNTKTGEYTWTNTVEETGPYTTHIPVIEITETNINLFEE